MPDLDDDLYADDMMTTLFADVRHEVAPHIRPAGAAAAFATVKRRRRNRTIAAGALAVALVVGPAIGFAWANNGPDKTPEIATTPSVGASESVSASPSTQPSASVSSAVADPGIPADQLRNMTLSVPSWPGEVGRIECPSGSLKFTAGKSTRKPGGSFQAELVGDPAHVDLDADGRYETVVRVDCHVQAVYSQVVAFARGVDGKVSTLGRVVGTHGENSDVQKIWKVEAGGPGAVRVDVGDYSPCCGIPGDLPQHLWRTYGWDGGKFRQTGGPTTFPPNPKTVDLVAVTRPLKAASADGGATWTGSLSASARNKGPRDAPSVQVTMTFPVEVTVSGPDAGACESPTVRSVQVSCTYGKLVDGQTRDLSFQFVAYGDPRGKNVIVQVSHGDDYPDVNQDDNRTTAAITS